MSSYHLRRRDVWKVNRLASVLPSFFNHFCLIEHSGGETWQLGSFCALYKSADDQAHYNELMALTPRMMVMKCHRCGQAWKA